VSLSDYDYALPDSLIAREPASPRDHSRLLRVSRRGEILGHHRFFEITAFLRKGDLLILNNTKVLPARLFGKLADKTFEILLLKQVSTGPLGWSCLVKPGRKIREATRISLAEGILADVIRTREGTFQINFPHTRYVDFSDWLYRVGEPPLPPYLKREARAEDRIHYQTVFARVEGSIAAPTAGLHFTPELLETVRALGVQIEEITLHVGYGTFAPLDSLAQETLHEESFEVSPSTLDRIRETRARQGRVIAVGTTSLRALESAALHRSRTTTLFIKPGHHFQYVDGLVTNFHLPQSSLLVLVAAFLGQDEAKACYETAVKERYRFFSYGDAMLIL
jgi:S-adenosylmethionine:tRNA ribosyltransferase-isomerase